MSLNQRITPVCTAPFITAVLIALAGCNPGAGPGRPTPPPPEVGILVMAPEDIALETELPGRTSAYLVADVRPQVDGIIRERLFTEGGDVGRGDPLYRIDPATYQADVASGEAAVAKAEAALTTTRLKAQRYRQLLNNNAVSQQEMDEMEAMEQQAIAEVAAQKALLQRARIDLDRTRITAPIKGRIGKSAVTAGALVTANQPLALATIQQIDPMYVDIPRSSLELLHLREELANGRLQAGKQGKTRVTLLLEDGTVYPHTGHLAFTDVTIDPGTASVTLRAVFPNPKGHLLPGMYVRARLEEGLRTDTLLIPQQAVIRTPQGDATVMVLDETNTASPRPVTLGRAQGNRWIVEKGLAAGERIVTEGLMKVRPGSLVVPTERPATAAAGPAAASAPNAAGHSQTPETPAAPEKK